MNFTNDEMNLMCIYGASCKTRRKVIDALTEMRGYLQPDEAELRELTDSTVKKLREMSDAEFEKIDLVPEIE